jgi:flagellar basal-body rod modification protein FlgD
MAAAAAGIWNQHTQAASALTGKSATPMTGPASGSSGSSSTSSSSSSSSSSATITANDFLTLLVTEMQNQDPTADTDPNEYINQLVQVNSLEQLIDINQNLSTALGDSSTSSSSTESASSASSASGLKTQVHGAEHNSGTLTASPTAGTSTTSAAQTSTVKHAPGNLSVPEAKPSAHRVAQALDGQSHVS